MKRSLERLGHRAISALSWAALLVLGAFGVFFSFANYPWFGIGVTLAIVVLFGISQRRRRPTSRSR